MWTNNNSDPFGFNNQPPRNIYEQVSPFPSFQQNSTSSGAQAWGSTSSFGSNTPAWGAEPPRDTGIFSGIKNYYAGQQEHAHQKYHQQQQDIAAIVRCDTAVKRGAWIGAAGGAMSGTPAGIGLGLTVGAAHALAMDPDCKKQKNFNSGGKNGSSSWR